VKQYLTNCNACYLFWCKICSIDTGIGYFLNLKNTKLLFDSDGNFKGNNFKNVKKCYMYSYSYSPFQHLKLEDINYKTLFQKDQF
jgi:hypothetical protein